MMSFSDHNLESNVPLIVAIDGNIGSGKTAVIKELCKHMDIEPIFEDIETWQHMGIYKNVDSLQLMYTDFEHNFTAFQVIVQLSRYEQLLKAFSQSDKPFIVCERDIRSGPAVFARLHLEKGHINKLSYMAIAEMANKTQKHMAAALIIFLETDPKICKTRINIRGRKSEADLIDDLKTSEKDLTIKSESNHFTSNRGSIFGKANEDQGFISDLDETYRKVLLMGSPVFVDVQYPCDNHGIEKTQATGDMFFFNKHLHAYVGVVNNNDGNITDTAKRIKDIIQTFYTQIYVNIRAKTDRNAFRILLKDKCEYSICQDKV